MRISERKLQRFLFGRTRGYCDGHCLCSFTLQNLLITQMQKLNLKSHLHIKQVPNPRHPFGDLASYLHLALIIFHRDTQSECELKSPFWRLLRDSVDDKPQPAKWRNFTFSSYMSMITSRPRFCITFIITKGINILI